MARLVYACRFDVPGAVAWDTLVRPQYQGWIAERYRKAFDASVNPDFATGEIKGNVPLGHLLNIRRFQSDDTATEIEWSFPGEQGLIWRNIVRIAQISDRCVVEHRIEISSAEYLVSPAGYSLGAPAVIRDLCRNDVFVGEMYIRATVYPLKMEGIEQFLDLLSAKQRRLPVVFLTPFANGEPCYIDPRALARNLAGVAIVTEADTPETTRALSDRIGRLGCYDGGIRIYWPGFKSDDDLRRHPLMLASKIALSGTESAARTIERTIFSVAAFRFAPDPRISGIISKSEAAARAERAQEAVSQGDGTWEQYALEMSEQLDVAKSELEELRAENENLRANQDVLFAFSEQADDDEIAQESVAREPASVTEAVKFAESDCPNLVFLESSFASADDSPFKRPGEIYGALSTMNKTAEVWDRNQGGGDLRLMLKNAGLGKRVSNFISQTTRGKWASEYTFSYEGKDILFEWHVTLGAGAADTCASIHFYPDVTKGKLVVGHVGRHLTNTKA